MGWRDAPLVEDTPKWQQAPLVDEQTTETAVEEPRTKSEATLRDIVQRSRAETGLSIPGQIGEGIMSVAGNIGSMAVSGLAGLAQYANQATAGQGLDLPSSLIAARIPKDERPVSDYGQPAKTVESIQRGGSELFAAESVGGQAVAEGLGAAVETAGTAIKYPLSAVPFFIGGTEEREKFMEMPMSKYLGELAEDHGASPLFSTLAHMIPDVALAATGAGGASKVKNIKAAPPKPKPPTIEELKAQSTALYDIVDNAGIRISDEAFSAAVDSIRANVRQSGARRSLSPKTWKALDELAADAKAGGITLKQAEELRRVLKKAQGGADADLASASRALREYDKFIEGLTPKQLSGAAGKETVEYLKSARSLWSRARKTEQIEDLIETAGLNAGMFSGSGFENALRTQFRALARNKKQMRMFTAAEQKVIRAVAMGTPYSNIMRGIGRAAPTGVVSAALGSGAGYAIAGPIGAAAVPAVGTAARILATRATVKASKKARDTMAQETP